MIGYYDRLSNEFKDKDTKNILEQIKPRLIVSKIPLKPPSNIPRFSSKSNSLLLLNPSSGAVSKKLQIVSPNVQRMISSHQTTTETISSSQSSIKSSFVNGLNPKSLISNRNTTSNLHSRRILLKNNHSKSSGIFTAIPLSKNLSKISQSNSLLDSIEPIVHTITDNNCNKTENHQDSDSEKTPTNSDNSDNNKFIYNKQLNNNNNYKDTTNLNSNQSTYSDDDDNIQNVLDKTSELINSLLYGNANETGRLHIQETKIPKDFKQIELIDEELKMKKSKENRHKYKSLNLDHSDNDEVYKDDAICETKSMENVTDDTSLHLQPTASPKLSYSRAKLLSNRQLASPTQSPKLYMNRKIGETITSTSDNILNAAPSSTSPKHRPLSAASISSSSSTSSASTTSSSNSFGAEQLIGSKAIPGITYLASIESLADHSENDGIEHISLTMCERAAMEILDSEKSYVEDLRQIIQGLVIIIIINNINAFYY